MVYKNAPVRNTDNEKYEKLTKKKDKWMKEAERQARTVPVIAVRPVIPKEQDYFNYEIVRQFFAEEDPINRDRFKSIRYLAGFEDSEDGLLWYYWSDENFVILNDMGNPVKDQEKYGGNPEGQNPYGEIPFSFFRFNNVIDDCWIGGSDALVNANLNIDIALSDLNWLHRYASFKQPVIVANAEDLDKVKFGYNNIIKMTPNSDPTGQNTDFRIEDIQADFKNSFYLIQKNMDLISMTEGVNLNWELKGTPSGFSLVVKNMDLLADWEDDIDFCRDWEQDLFEKEKLIYETDTNNSFPGKELSINFAEVKFPVDPKEERAKWDWEIKNNFATHIDYMKSQDPDATEEELQKRFEQNKEINSQQTTLVENIET